MDYQEHLKKVQEINEIKQARVRGYGVCLTHFFLAPVASVYYAVSTNYWKPFLFASGVAALGVPVALVDYGLTLAIAPPVTSAAMVLANTNEKRRKLEIISPDQADAMMFAKS
jgi:hypothetical protein